MVNENSKTNLRKVELLSPVGDKESLLAAVANGADAVYLGTREFNARINAKNFSGPMQPGSFSILAVGK